ncbi:MAG TPA: hypothetical protein VFH73_24365 [Polyangia bacterium]|jgi:hypothetical protein|nr:hypothetical protein [Polyangia bacterium]
MRIANLMTALGALAVVACSAASGSPDSNKDGGAPPAPHDGAAADGTAADSPADSTLDAGRDAPVEASDARPDAPADSFFTFPETALPPEGLASCMIFSPASGGGCVCSVQKSGHLYQVNCAGNSDPCTCAIDNTPTKMIPNDVCGNPMAFIRECGFP